MELQESKEASRKGKEELKAHLSFMTEANEAVNLLLKFSQEDNSLINRIKRKYQHWKAKASCYLQHLSFVPWLRGIAWSRGFWWGFENFRTIVMNHGHFRLDVKIVTRDTL